MNKELLLFIAVISKKYLSASDSIFPHTHLQFSVTIFQFLAVSFSYVSTFAERMLNTVFEFTEPSGPFPADECDTSLLQLAITFLQTSLLPLGQTCHALFLSPNLSWFPFLISQLARFPKKPYFTPSQLKKNIPVAGTGRRWMRSASF